MGIKAHYIKPYTITTKDCDFSTKLKNILKRNFNPKKPNSAWCTDITYIWTQEDGFVYLSSIMDLYSRKIIDWKLTKTITAKISYILVVRNIDIVPFSKFSIGIRRNCIISRESAITIDKAAPYT